jgi:hypothetical protein
MKNFFFIFSNQINIQKFNLKNSSCQKKSFFFIIKLK